MEPSKIRKLDTVVVNRIAAGEVIQRPANALKELLENSIDAKSSAIQITVKDGGMKSLLIQDNGCGIRKEDLEILCERFTTSKLKNFEDLLTIETFGFRGEALASISHVAHLTVTTRTSNSKCAFKATYMDGILREAPKPCAGNRGTIILVEDLFYNVATRKAALKNLSDEFNRILDVVTRYAVHNPTIGFTVKKKGENLADLRTIPKSTTLDNIRTLYSNGVARELLELKYEDAKLGFDLTGYISNANYSVKKFALLLFINNRSVHSTAMKKILEVVYSNYLPKGMYPWIYLSLHITPQNVDVNVHPTKHEVHFLHEEMILDKIQKIVEEKLLGCNSSRTFYTQTLLPSANLSSIEQAKSCDSKSDQNKPYAHLTVRTDSRDQKLDKFLLPEKSVTEENLIVGNDDLKSVSIDETGITSNDFSVKSVTLETGGDETIVNDNIEEKRNKASSFDPNDAIVQAAEFSKDSLPTRNKLPERRVIKLLSVIKLKKAVEEDISPSMKEVIQRHTFVGVVNLQFALIQYQTKLYLCNTIKLSEELFYQLLLEDFGNFGLMKLSNAASIYDLALLALDSEDSGWTEDDGPKEDLAKYVSQFLISKKEMLDDYFSLQIDDEGQLLSLPWILENYIPDLTKLPMFVLRLATEVNWDSEKECFHSFCRETAIFYSLPKHCLEDETPTWKKAIEFALYPTFKSYLQPPKWSSTDATFLEIANLPDLYKVFERC